MRNNTPPPPIAKLCYLGIDLSLLAPGFCILDFRGNVLNSGTVDGGKLPHYQTPLERYRFLSEAVFSAIPLKRGECQGIFPCLENYAMKGIGPLTKIAECGGVFLSLLCYQMGVHPHAVRKCAPATLKKFATGKGSGPKSKIMLEVYKRWGFQGQDDNEVDAFVLALVSYHVHNEHLDHTLISAQRQAIEKVRKDGIQ